MRLTKREYRDFLRQTVDKETGGRFDWSAVSPGTWDRWWNRAYAAEDVLREAADRKLTPPPTEPSQTWLCVALGAAVAAAIALLAVVTALFGETEE